MGKSERQAEEPAALIEEKIAAALAKGDTRGAAHDALIGYGPELLGYLVAVLRDEDAGREAFARLAERMWRDIGHFRGEASFRTWLYRLAWTAVSRQRRDPYRRRARQLEDAGEAVTPGARSATAPFVKTTIKSWVAGVRGKLSDEEQTLLILRVDRNLSWRDVAMVLAEDSAVDEAALRKRFERLKRKLRALAAKDGVAK